MKELYEKDGKEIFRLIYRNEREFFLRSTHEKIHIDSVSMHMENIISEI